MIYNVTLAVDHNNSWDDVLERLELHLAWLTIGLFIVFFRVKFSLKVSYIGSAQQDLFWVFMAQLWQPDSTWDFNGYHHPCTH